VRRGATVFESTNVLGWLFVVLLGVVLEIAVRRLELQDSVAAPSDALRALVDGLASGELSGEIGTTLSRWAQAFALAVVVGITLGILIGSSRTLGAASFGPIEFLRPIPAVALIPVATFLFGLGTSMVRFAVAYAAVWPILVNTIYGVRGSDRMLDDVARTAGVTGVTKLARVTLPAALPSIATGIRVSASIALLVVVTAEFLYAPDGLGAYMKDRQTALEIPELYSAVVLVGLLGYALNLGLRSTQRRLVFWVGEERSA
jgi:NitT/TauT family transport system permease protein